MLVDTQSCQEMVDAIGILKLLSQSEHAVESGDVGSHHNAIATAREAIHDR